MSCSNLKVVVDLFKNTFISVVIKTINPLILCLACVAAVSFPFQAEIGQASEGERLGRAKNWGEPLPLLHILALPPSFVSFA